MCAVSASLAPVAEPAGAWSGGARPPGLAGGRVGWEVKIVCRLCGVGVQVLLPLCGAECDSRRPLSQVTGGSQAQTCAQSPVLLPQTPHTQTGCSADRQRHVVTCGPRGKVSCPLLGKPGQTGAQAGGPGARWSTCSGGSLLISDPGGLTLAWPSSCGQLQSAADSLPLRGGVKPPTPLTRVSPHSFLGQQSAGDVVLCDRGGWVPGALALAACAALPWGQHGGALVTHTHFRVGTPLQRHGTRHVPDILRLRWSEACRRAIHSGRACSWVSGADPSLAHLVSL